jgi:hypothetical protein
VGGRRWIVYGRESNSRFNLSVIFALFFSAIEYGCC